ncbi:MAG: TIGR02391 family protein [Deltaproteobacteria bacterium]|nr:TIGR02391 family protein [Deltaproteobacteria bacterium]
MAAKKPIPPKTNMRGITLFSRKKLVNLPDYFSDSTSSHFFSYLTGWLEVDFIDDLKDDVIATNRQSLNWGHDETKKLKDYLREMINWLERDWRKKRETNRRDNLSKSSGINVTDWLSKLPDDIREKMEPIIETFVKDSELPDETNLNTVRNIHYIVPEYPLYHWRHLHSEIQSASRNDYQNRDYYRAFQEAVKRYINEVKTKSGSTDQSDSTMMGNVFGKSSSANPNGTSLRVAQNFRKPSGDDFSSQTINDIENGQKFLSMGVVSGCRNPVSHEEIADLRDSGLFTEKDCLDALSLLSHLFNRLNNA